MVYSCVSSKLSPHTQWSILVYLPNYSPFLMVYSVVSSKLSPHTQWFILVYLPNYPHILNGFFWCIFQIIPHTQWFILLCLPNHPHILRGLFCCVFQTNPHTQLLILACLPIYFYGPNMLFRRTQYVVLAFQPIYHRTSNVIQACLPGHHHHDHGPQVSFWHVLKSITMYPMCCSRVPNMLFWSVFQLTCLTLCTLYVKMDYLSLSHLCHCNVLFSHIQYNSVFL